MGINTYSADDRPNQGSPHAFDKLNRILADSDLARLKEILGVLSAKHKISPEDLTKIASKEENITVPTSIYSTKKLSVLEVTVKYLKEELNLRFSVISKLLNRDERTIWATYSNAMRKSPSPLSISESVTIPINVLSDRRYSILEQAVGFLKEEYGMKFSQIARLLKRDDRTIWTCYSRLKKKREGGNEAG